jgi:hypothetical protein
MMSGGNDPFENLSQLKSRKISIAIVGFPFYQWVDQSEEGWWQVTGLPT